MPQRQIKENLKAFLDIFLVQCFVMPESGLAGKRLFSVSVLMCRSGWLTWRCLFLTPDIGTVLADGREDHLGDPVLEGLGLGFVGAEGQLEQSALGDDRNSGATFGQTKDGPGQALHLAFIQGSDSEGDVHDAEDFDNVLRHEPGVPVDGHHADGRGVEGEGGQLERAVQIWADLIAIWTIELPMS